MMPYAMLTIEAIEYFYSKLTVMQYICSLNLRFIMHDSTYNSLMLYVKVKQELKAQLIK